MDDINLISTNRSISTCHASRERERERERTRDDERERKEMSSSSPLTNKIIFPDFEQLFEYIRQMR